MHVRNPYRNPPDILLLADAYPALKACRRLTEALLKRDFNITVQIPDDRLCPPVPNRLNYILWLQDILSETLGDQIRGIDIGTGASAIYPLLACRLDSRWRFVATEIDEKSYTCALSNIGQNNLQGHIELVRATPDGPLFPFSLFPDATFDFTMCNPPFYTSKAEVEASADGKLREPKAVCTGAEVEMITPGGEAAFVKRMIDESLDSQERCRWYTSMLGKFSSLAGIVEYLNQREISNYGITEFVQGQTRRWAIIWSFTKTRLPDYLGRIRNPTIQHLMPPRNTLRQPFSTTNLSRLTAALENALANLDSVTFAPNTVQQTVAVSDDEELLLTDILISATRNSWSRAARRKAKNPNAASQSAMEIEASTVVMRCRLQIRRVVHSHDRADKQEGLVVDASWMEGQDRALFDSFVSHVMRKAEMASAE
ncbi:hypothetical protein NEOLEDRAFT_1165857 [Neolentinus lepideus HHB14362 ss-1]|uniref:S-adenosyl-L-methionine dependent methyltransferase n=1 Tax=Neolentinus lepideus HHB14362 ss-1 TaxID=1314782 RepID=A0A165M807_9AGAM|nr:hypothetical protein NEOLEDRAFT_1165857 [Neolentinus lepideus HHB14362 ss-1]